MTHDYKPNGTATLFAALNVANGEVYGLCQERHRHQRMAQVFAPALHKKDTATGISERNGASCPVANEGERRRCFGSGRWTELSHRSTFRSEDQEIGVWPSPNRDAASWDNYMTSRRRGLAQRHLHQADEQQTCNANLTRVRRFIRASFLSAGLTWLEPVSFMSLPYLPKRAPPSSRQMSI
jgi:hypothetical protein